MLLIQSHVCQRPPIICLTNCPFIIFIPPPMRRYLREYFGLEIFSICWRPSLPVCPVHCGLTRLQGPRGRRMEERRRRRRRRWRRWRRRLGKRRPDISTTLPTLSFPFTNGVKDKPGRGLLHRTQLIFLSTCKCCCTLHSAQPVKYANSLYLSCTRWLYFRMSCWNNRSFFLFPISAFPVLGRGIHSAKSRSGPGKICLGLIILTVLFWCHDPIREFV